MSTRNTGLPNTLANGQPVSPGAANRLHNIVDAQTFGALSAIGAGIIENEDGTSLQISDGGGLGVAVAAGQAIVQSALTQTRASHAVWGTSAGDPFVPVVPSATSFIHARLVMGDRSGDPDADEGTEELEIVALPDEVVIGALLLATVVADNAGIVSITPANFYIKPDAAIKALLQIQADLAYNSTHRALGTVAARLDKLEGRTETDEEPELADLTGYVTKIEFFALKQTLAGLRADFEAYRLSVADDSVVGVSETPSSLLVNMGKAIGNIVNLDPSSARHFIAGVDMPDATGDAQNLNGQTQPVVRIGGNAEYDEQTGTIHG